VVTCPLKVASNPAGPLAPQRPSELSVYPEPRKAPVHPESRRVRYRLFFPLRNPLPLPSLPLTPLDAALTSNPLDGPNSQAVISLPTLQSTFRRGLSSLISYYSSPLTTFRINTCKSVSKQKTLTPFGINTYKKGGGDESTFLIPLRACTFTLTATEATTWNSS
jgi:hypothetical protein